jgi:hypothetical protein
MTTSHQALVDGRVLRPLRSASCRLGASRRGARGFTDHDGIGHWPIPHPYAHPSSCSVAAEGQLEGSHGTKINIWLTYTR